MKPTEHGELWLANLDKRRPVVVVSRDDVQGRRGQATIAPITRTIFGIASEVLVDHRDGLPEVSAINCDAVQTVAKTKLERRLGRLSAPRIEALDHALRFALGLR